MMVDELVTRTRIMALWLAGNDTTVIARTLRLPEAEVYNTLAKRSPKARKRQA